MKYVVKKVIKGKQYYYLQYDEYSKFLGQYLPDDLKQQFFIFFQEIALKSFEKIPSNIKDTFKYGDLKILEQLHFGYFCLKHELFSREYADFFEKFVVLFTYNSNKTEGSKVKRLEIEEFLKSKVRKPKNKTQIEIMDSFLALNEAFSDEFEWSLKNIRWVHELLLGELDPLIAGDFKNEENVAPGNQPTVSPAEVVKNMKELVEWLNEQFKNKIYPPLIALQFYAKFEAIHPFIDGNGRVGRILLNAILNKFDYPPVVFFASNKVEHFTAIRNFLNGRKTKLYKHFLKQLNKTYKIIKLFN